MFEDEDSFVGRNSVPSSSSSKASQNRAQQVQSRKRDPTNPAGQAKKQRLESVEKPFKVGEAGETQAEAQVGDFAASASSRKHGSDSADSDSDSGTGTPGIHNISSNIGGGDSGEPKSEYQSLLRTLEVIGQTKRMQTPTPTPHRNASHSGPLKIARQPRPRPQQKAKVAPPEPDIDIIDVDLIDPAPAASDRAEAAEAAEEPAASRRSQSSVIPPESDIDLDLIEIQSLMPGHARARGAAAEVALDAPAGLAPAASDRAEAAEAAEEPAASRRSQSSVIPPESDIDLDLIEIQSLMPGHARARGAAAEVALDAPAGPAPAASGPAEAAEAAEEPAASRRSRSSVIPNTSVAESSSIFNLSTVWIGNIAVIKRTDKKGEESRQQVS